MLFTFRLICLTILKWIYSFKQTYPEFYFYLIEYIRWLTAKHKNCESQSLFVFNYLLLLINHVPVHLIAEPAKVLIDFSYGKEYNQFIKKFIRLCEFKCRNY